MRPNRFGWEPMSLSRGLRNFKVEAGRLSSFLHDDSYALSCMAGKELLKAAVAVGGAWAIRDDRGHSGADHRRGSRRAGRKIRRRDGLRPSHGGESAIHPRDLGAGNGKADVLGISLAPGHHPNGLAAII